MTTAASYFQTHAEADFDLQRPADVAVIMPTIIRPTMKEALQSVFRQAPARRIQILIGIDRPAADVALIEAICAERPAHCCVNVIYPGYSTSLRHGGLHPASDGGVLRCVLTYLANSQYVAYLDDDNWWADNHLSSMLAAIKDHHWAYSLRWFVHPDTRRTICIDQWESVGPGRGVFAQAFGGWVDPNCLMFDKLACHQAIPWCRRPPGVRLSQSALPRPRHGACHGLLSAQSRRPQSRRPRAGDRRRLCRRGGWRRYCAAIVADRNIRCRDRRKE